MEILIDEVTRSPLEELESDFMYKETIASGSFGTVIRAIQLSDNKEVAIKILSKDSRKFDTMQIKQEISILKQLDHPNIVQFLSYSETNSKLYIIMEYIPSGTLQHWIDQHKGPVTETEASIILQQLISAVAYLHSKDICHRDIKPDNIMFNRRNDVNSLQLIDFGLSAGNFNGFEEYDYCGTFIYMAPEQIEQKSYSKYVDLWSIGIIMYLMLNNGKHPYFVQGDHKRTYIQKIKNSVLKMVNQISEMAERLLRALLEPNPNLRIKAKNALIHPWVTRQMFDPIPLNYYQSLTRASIRTKLKQAMIAATFLNNFSKENNINTTNKVFIINDNYVKKIEEENRNEKIKFRKEREKSFEVVKPKEVVEIKIKETITSLLSSTSNKIKLTKTKLKDNASKANSHNNNTPLKNYSNRYFHKKGFSESKTPVPLKSNVRQFIVKDSPSILNVNSLTNRDIGKSSIHQIRTKHNTNAVNTLRVSINRDHQKNALSKGTLILPIISNEPYINSTSFLQSLRDRSCNHHHVDLCFSPLRNRKTLSTIKQENENNNKINSLQNNNSNNNMNSSIHRESNKAKMNLQPNDDSKHSPKHTKIIKQVKPLYLPNINRLSPNKKRLVILSNNIIIEP